MPTLTVTEVADSIATLSGKFTIMFKSQGWNEEMPLNSWQGYLPAYSVKFILDYITHTADRVRALSTEDLEIPGLSSFLASVPTIVDGVNVQQLPNDPATTIHGLMNTFNMINARLPSHPKGPLKLDWEDVDEKSLVPKDLARRLRAIDTRLTDLEPRSAEIKQKISEIEAAHETAEQLPEDLAELAHKRNEVQGIVEQANALISETRKTSSSVQKLSEEAIDARANISKSEAQAAALIERSEQALRGSTGVGLANAFEKRKMGLSVTGGFWVFGLILALAAAFLIGSERVSALQTLLTKDSPSHIVWMNVVLTVFGLGGPIWFAWLSTKQIGVTFRLAEDYAFKAAVSKAYEGYRKEAIEIDPSLKARLFSSALDRLEEAPIRLMEKESHSSPLQELLSNPAIRKSLDNIPGIADKIIALIPEKGGIAAVVGTGAAVTAAVTGQAKPAGKAKAKAEDE